MAESMIILLNIINLQDRPMNTVETDSVHYCKL